MTGWTCRINYPTRQKGRKSADCQGPERSDECEPQILSFTKSFQSHARSEIHFLPRVRDTTCSVLMKTVTHFKVTNSDCRLLVRLPRQFPLLKLQQRDPFQERTILEQSLSELWMRI